MIPKKHELLQTIKFLLPVVFFLCFDFLLLDIHLIPRNYQPASNAHPEFGNGADGSVPAEQLTDTTIDILMAGDILLHSNLLDRCRNADGSYSFSSFFSNTAPFIRNTDISIVNQEVIIGGKELGISGYPAFNAPAEIADELVNAGFNVICHATNHVMDRGTRGILNCLDNWKKYPEVQVTGIYSTPEDSRQLCIVEKNGIRVAILNYTYNTNFIAIPADFSYGVNLLDEKKVLSDLAKAREQADFIIVCPHWGTEYVYEITAMQKKWTQLFLENGVDLVLGTHPHVIQPIETLVDEETGHQMTVYYSLGNFVNWTGNTGKNCRNQCVGGLAYVRLNKAKDGIVCIADSTVYPTVCHLTEEEGGITVYLMDDYSEELAEKNAINLQEKGFTYEWCRNLAEFIWPGYVAENAVETVDTGM